MHSSKQPPRWLGVVYLVLFTLASCRSSLHVGPRESRSSPEKRPPAYSGTADEELFSKNTEKIQKPLDREQLDQLLGMKGIIEDEVYTAKLRRPDLSVVVEGMDVPPGAFPSIFHFYYCPCGKMVTVGEFIVADYEANDVIDELRAGHFRIASIGPALIYDEPRLAAVRYYSEGQVDELAATIKKALRWTGENRMPRVPKEDQDDWSK